MISEQEPFLGIEQSISGRFWRQRVGSERDALALAQRLGLPEIIGRVLAARGVGIEEADDFLNPSLKASLPDPSEFKDMDAAVERLVDAVVGNEKIAIFGNKKWQEYSAKVGSWFITGDIKYFEDADAALSWLQNNE